eukprot:gene23843-biopygen13401
MANEQPPFSKQTGYLPRTYDPRNVFPRNKSAGWSVAVHGGLVSRCARRAGQSLCTAGWSVAVSRALASRAQASRAPASRALASRALASRSSIHLVPKHTALITNCWGPGENSFFAVQRFPRGLTHQLFQFWKVRRQTFHERAHWPGGKGGVTVFSGQAGTPAQKGCTPTWSTGRSQNTAGTARHGRHGRPAGRPAGRRATGRATGRASGCGGVGGVRVKHSPRSLRSLVE